MMLRSLNCMSCVGLRFYMPLIKRILIDWLTDWDSQNTLKQTHIHNHTRKRDTNVGVTRWGSNWWCHSIFSSKKWRPFKVILLWKVMTVLANVNSRLYVCCMSSPVRMSSVYLSVTFVHPTQAIEIFGMLLRHLVPWPSLTFRQNF